MNWKQGLGPLVLLGLLIGAAAAEGASAVPDAPPAAPASPAEASPAEAPSAIEPASEAETPEPAAAPVAAEPAEPAEIAEAPEPAEAAEPGEPVETTTPAPRAAAGSPAYLTVAGEAPGAWCPAASNAGLSEAREALTAKLEELQERRLISAEGATELIALLEKLAAEFSSQPAPASFGWTTTPPAGDLSLWLAPLAEGQAGEWSTAPQVLELQGLELEALAGLHCACPLAATIPPGEWLTPEALAAGQTAESLKALRIELANGAVLVEGQGLSTEELAKVKAEIEAAHSSAAGQHELAIIMQGQAIEELANAELKHIELAKELAGAQGECDAAAKALAELELVELKLAQPAGLPQLAQLEIKLAQLGQLDGLEVHGLAGLELGQHLRMLELEGSPAHGHDSALAALFEEALALAAQNEDLKSELNELLMDFLEDSRGS